MRWPIRGRWERFGVHDVDVVVTVALLVFSLVSVATSTPAANQRGGDVVTYTLVVALTVPFLAHRRYPLAALGVTVAAFLALAGLHSAFYPGLQLFALLCGIALHANRRRSLVALAVSLLAMLAGLALQPAGVTTSSDWTSSLLATAVAWLVGEQIGNRRARWRAMEERAATLERERVERDRQAALAERIRIARELHDIVAHSLGVVAIQSAAAHHLLESNPTEAARALAVVETTSRSAMVEMRQLVGVLRDDDAQLDTPTPTPGVADLPALIAQLRAAGLGVDYAVEGLIDDLPAGIDTSAYRIVQEALTNVIKHGGPIARVTIQRDGDTLRIAVQDDGAPTPRRSPFARPGSGHGLIGMRERVGVFGGRLSAHPRPGGGFDVSATLPVTTPDTPGSTGSGRSPRAASTR